MLRKLALVLVLIAGTGIVSKQSLGLELGLTPSNVVSLWTNINDALLAGAKVLLDDPKAIQNLDSMTPNRFEGKTPADVLGAVIAYRGKLDGLRRKSGLDPTTKVIVEDGAEVTPSVVFLNSGHVLDGLVLWLIANTPNEQLISQFYTRHDISGKTPSDAYSMVDLANRRMDQLLSSVGS